MIKQDMTFDELASIARDAALLAGEALKKRFGTSFNISHKKDAGLLTEADLEAEEILIGKIRATRPGDAILAEESGIASAGSSKGALRWIIDPLDGTTNFAHGVPHYCVSIGVEREGEMIIGVVYNPVSKELFEAIKGRGMFLSGKKKNVSQCTAIEESLLATGFSYRGGEMVEREVEVLGLVLHRVRAIRRFGSAALDLCYVAIGRFDGFWEYDLSPWDIAAGVLMVTEAGGEVSNMKGKKCDLEDGNIVASNGKIHHSLLEFLE